jgi:hypothetical protein
LNNERKSRRNEKTKHAGQPMPRIELEILQHASKMIKKIDVLAIDDLEKDRQDSRELLVQRLQELQKKISLFLKAPLAERRDLQNPTLDTQRTHIQIWQTKQENE